MPEAEPELMNGILDAVSHPIILNSVFGLALLAALVAAVSHAVFVFRLKQTRPDLWAACQQARRSMQRYYAAWLLAAAGTNQSLDTRTRRWWLVRIWSMRLLALFLALTALGFAGLALRPGGR